MLSWQDRWHDAREPNTWTCHCEAWTCNLDKDIKDLSSLETYNAAGDTKEQRDDIVGNG